MTLTYTTAVTVVLSPVEMVTRELMFSGNSGPEDCKGTEYPANLQGAPSLGVQPLRAAYCPVLCLRHCSVLQVTDTQQLASPDMGLAMGVPRGCPF